MIKILARLILSISFLISVVYGAESFTKVRASHILVKSANEAIQIKKDIENGGNFEYYAQLYSLCPSGQRGGDLGYFSRGQMVPEFERKAFSM